MKSAEEFLKVAIDLAVRNAEPGRGGPFGAVIVENGEVLASGRMRQIMGLTMSRFARSCRGRRQNNRFLERCCCERKEWPHSELGSRTYKRWLIEVQHS